MINPITSTPVGGIRPSDLAEAPQPYDPKPDAGAEIRPVPKSGELSDDQVTLKSAGQSDTDADRS